jgi:hypothetical protein
VQVVFLETMEPLVLLALLAMSEPQAQLELLAQMVRLEPQVPLV